MEELCCGRIVCGRIVRGRIVHGRIVYGRIVVDPFEMSYISSLKQRVFDNSEKFW